MHTRLNQLLALLSISLPDFPVFFIDSLSPDSHFGILDEGFCAEQISPCHHR
jgi:hypothetical protein